LAGSNRKRLPEEEASPSLHEQLVLSATQLADDRIINPTLDPKGSAADNHFDVGLGDVHDHLAARQ
jgi:hypothetical protein